MRGRLIQLPSRRVSLFVKEIGQGYPMLLMHGGLGVDHSTLLAMQEASDALRLIFYDHRCNGRSRGAELSSLTWENLSLDAEALREALGITQWAVLGHSFGGMIAQEYALRYPRSISHLILMDTGSDASVVQKGAAECLKERGYRPSQVKAARMLFGGELSPRAVPLAMLRLQSAYYHDHSLAMRLKVFSHTLKMRANTKACMHGFHTLLKGWSTLKRLEEIAMPVLLLAGTEDFQFPPEHQREMASALPHACYVPIEGCSHNPLDEAPEKALAAIRQFLSGAGMRPTNR